MADLAPPLPPLQPVKMSQMGGNHNQGGSASDPSAPLAPVPLRGVPMMQQHHYANVMMPRYAGDGEEQQQDPNCENMDKQHHFMPYGGGGPPHIMGAPSFPPPMGAEMPVLGGSMLKGGAGSAAGGGEPDPNDPSSHHHHHDHHMMMHHYGPPPQSAEEMDHAPHMMYDGGGGEYYHPLAYSPSAEENMPHGPPPPAGAPDGWYPPPPSHYNPHHGGPSPTMMDMPPPPLPPSEYYGHHHPHSLPLPPPPPLHMMMMYDQQGPPSVDGSFSLGGALPPPQPLTDEEATADGSLPSLLTAPSGGTSGTNMEGAYSHHQYNPPPAGLPSGLQKDTYIQDPDSYITSNLAIAEHYRRVNPEVHIGFRPRKATTVKAGGTLSKRQLHEGTRKRKVKSCTTKGCPRQSRGIKFDYMCQRHWNESKGIVSNFVDWRMLLQPDENNPGIADNKEKKGEEGNEKSTTAEDKVKVEENEERKNSKEDSTGNGATDAFEKDSCDAEKEDDGSGKVCELAAL